MRSSSAPASAASRQTGDASSTIASYTSGLTCGEPTRSTNCDARWSSPCGGASCTRSSSSSTPRPNGAQRPKRCSISERVYGASGRRPSIAAVSARETLIEELRRHALVLGEVTLTSGATAQYYVDAKRAVLRPAGFLALAELVAGYARDWEATAVGGLTMGADAPACGAPAGGAEVKAFFVRKEAKAHGLQ